jgi:hypothetical protein
MVAQVTPIPFEPRPFKLYTDLPFEKLEDLGFFADQIEAAGYSGIFTTENRHDAFLPLAAVARSKSQLKIGTAAIAILARSPFVVAQVAWDLHHSTGERFVLGVGTQTEDHLRGRFGIDCRNKHDRFLEAILAIRELWASWMEERQPHFDGEFYSIDSCPRAFRPTTKLKSLPQIFVLCSTERDLDVAARAADGIFTHCMWPRPYIDSIVLPRLSLNATTNIEVISGAIVCTGDNYQEKDASRIHARNRLSGYFCATTYEDVFSTIGVLTLISEFRNAVSVKVDPWRTDAGKALFKIFACDALFDNLPAELTKYHSIGVSGLFPNVMSRIRRVLPPHHVRAIVRASMRLPANPEEPICR